MLMFRYCLVNHASKEELESYCQFIWWRENLSFPSFGLCTPRFQANTAILYGEFS